MSAPALRVFCALLAVLGVAAGCASHREQVREFDRGRETAFFREQVARTRVLSRDPDASEDPGEERDSSLRDAKDRWIQRADERDDFAGILDLSDPAQREAFDAGGTAEGTDALLAHGPLPLHRLRALVAARSPAVRRARETWRATVEQIDQARWLEEVTAAYRSFARDLDTRIGGGAAGPRSMVAESYPWPAATALRGEMARLEVAMAREQSRMALVDALADAEESFAGAWEASERAHVLAGFLPMLRNMAEVAARRYATGRGSQDESLRIETEIRWMESDLATAKAQRASAEARINALLDRSPAAALPPQALPLLPDAAPGAEALVERAASAPEVGMADRARDLARVAVRLAEVMAHPLPASAAAPSARPGFGPAAEGGAGKGMSMEPGPGGGESGARSRPMADAMAPPWYGVEEAYIRELRRRAASSEAARNAALRRSEAMAQEAWRMLDAGLRELKVAEDTAVPLAEQAFDVSRRDYATGTGTFADHLEAWRALVRSRLAGLASRRMAVEARAAILRATATWSEE